MRAPEALFQSHHGQDRFTLSCDALPAETRVMRLSGSEGLSELYSFTLDVVMPEDAGLSFDMERAVSAPATLSILGGDGAARAVHHGMLAAVDWVQEVAGHTVYRVLLVPKLWALGLSQHSNVYVEQDVKAIITDVLRANGFSAADFEFRLNPANTYPPLPHVSQYRESDLAFLQRRMERDGLYFFFEQEGESEKLIITDSAAKHAQSGSVRYFPVAGGDTVGAEVFTTFTCRRQARPKLVRLREYDYVRPNANLKREESVSQSGRGEVVSHDENYATPGEGARLAQVRAEELRTREVLFEAQGSVLDVRAGYTFQLSEHPRFDGEYLAVRVEHEGTQGLALEGSLGTTDTSPSYTVRVEAIPARTQFRPARATPIPRIFGTEMGVVDGPQDGDYAQIDDHGRYKVHLFFDEVEGRSGKASTWVRMLQPHGGSQEGFHFPLRKGTEVMVVFLGGDPDRPVIAGVVPNSHTPSPVTQQNLTQNVLLTASGNLMRLEDSRGYEHVHLGTPNNKTSLHMGAADSGGNNLNLTTDGQGRIHTGGNLTVQVGGTMTETVQGAVTETYKSTQDLHVTGARSVKVDAAETVHVKSQDITTDANRSVTVGANQTHTVTGNDEHTITGQQKVTVTAGQQIDVTAGRTETITGTLTQTVTGAVMQTTGPRTVTVNGPVTENIAGTLTQTVLGATITSTNAYTVVAPNVQHVAPASLYKTGAFSGEGMGSKVSNVGLKFETVGTALAINGAKFDLTVFKYDKTGVQVKNNPLTVDQTKMKIKQTALGLYMYGLVLFS